MPIAVKHFFTTLALFILLSGCATTKVKRHIRKDATYQQAFSGFYVADAKTGQVLIDQNANRLFTPASNTKILTLATALAWLPQDSLPALAWQHDADTLRLWGLAYPSLAADTSPANLRIQRTIRSWPGTVEVNLHGYVTLPRFGEGWMWDDYPYAFARERSGLPVYRNMIRVWKNPTLHTGGTADSLRGNSTRFRTNIFSSQPDFLVIRPTDYVATGHLRRSETQNRFYANPAIKSEDTLFAPLYATAGLVTQLLEDWTEHPVRYHNKPLPVDWGTRCWKGEHRDSLLRYMMLPSDNFLAEQLFLQAGLYHADLTDPKDIRKKAHREILKLGEDQLVWADASGISHYNLVTPQGLGNVLLELYSNYGSKVFTEFFPAGGTSGTIRTWYTPKPGNKTFVYAKTGTLRHNHCLSGLLLTDSGRELVFSFMHNHYRGSSEDYKKAMEKTLLLLKSAY